MLAYIHTHTDTHTPTCMNMHLSATAQHDTGAVEREWKKAKEEERDGEEEGSSQKPARAARRTHASLSTIRATGVRFRVEF